jgi:hypothetical protein
MRGSLALSSIAVALASITPGVSGTTIDLASYPDYFRLIGRQIEDDTGREAVGCDLNGDGIQDLVLSAILAKGPGNARPACGEISILYGRRGRWLGEFDLQAARDVVIYGAEQLDEAGTALACGDVNGDGTDDVVIGIEWSAGPNNTRLDAGEARIIFGATDLPAEIDLLTEPVPVIYGERAGGRVCYNGSLAVGDINGDGYDDVVMGSSLVPGKLESKTRAGRAYVTFGRPSWPAVIDLGVTPPEVLIYGRNPLDIMANWLMTADYDLDGTEDLLVTAPGEDGPAGTRTDCGSTLLMRGRANWPTQIDLAFTNPSIRIFGAGANDLFAGIRSLNLGDLDLNGRPEIVIGARLADGRNNSTPDSGETRTYEPPASSPPATADLLTATRQVIYNEETVDVGSTLFQFGDVNRDGTQDLAIRNSNLDGPANSRTDCGEVSVFYPRIGFPIDQDMSAADLAILGAGARDALALTSLTDVNDDGFAEIGANSDIGLINVKTSLWLVSPFDFDGDGVTQLADNCPLVANADQADMNADLLGDLCEGDYDGDGQVDAIDCAANDASGGVPPPIDTLSFAVGSKTLLTWASVAFANRYDLLRGVVSALPTSDFGSCQNSLDPDLTDTSFVDPTVPAPGVARQYLVRGFNQRCAVAGSWGQRSDGSARVNTNPGSCP